MRKKVQWFLQFSWTYYKAGTLYEFSTVSLKQGVTVVRRVSIEHDTLRAKHNVKFNAIII